jgi:hypothetical protein
MMTEHIIPPDFVPPPRPNYVDHEGRRRDPSEYEVVEYGRKVIFAIAEHCGWGRYLGDRLPRASAGNMLRVVMTFEGGERPYFVDAEPPGDPLTRRRDDSFGNAV